MESDVDYAIPETYRLLTRICISLRNKSNYLTFYLFQLYTGVVYILNIISCANSTRKNVAASLSTVFTIAASEAPENAFSSTILDIDCGDLGVLVVDVVGAIAVL